jgi:peptidoglycan lytic transglycosylase G
VTSPEKGRALAWIVVILALVAALGAGGWLYLRSIGVGGESSPRGRARVQVPRGADASTIGRLLEERGVIRSALGFRIAVWLEGGGEDIQAGSYTLPRGLNVRDALRALLEGPEVDFVEVTFPEGSWLTDFAARIERDTHISGDRWLRLARSGRVPSRLQPPSVDTLEGLLWPSTYQVVRRDTATSLLRRLVTEFEQRAAGVDFTEARALGVSPYEAVIVASMIEAEAARDSERALIARVIYNRLREGTPLGIDATVSYALGEHKSSLTSEDLAVDSPYNTRVVAGLPPTPIGAPGLASLEAAAHPAPGDWFYYVLEDCGGRHAFSKTYEQFLADKAAYQRLDC